MQHKRRMPSQCAVGCSAESWAHLHAAAAPYGWAMRHGSTDSGDDSTTSNSDTAVVTGFERNEPSLEKPTEPGPEDCCQVHRHAT